ncbi:hypothetical protein Pmani_031192 [Petrolisthes manimaculis]|uniref:Uncharacterized protein n=1 Tax=Petrolisthes manimaculis TaxID=1843537 RepID=A0AAE1NV67_9EUCA|nr:hypothetical protein Pmani_031192 [Petrolisthes manimaculis]
MRTLKARDAAPPYLPTTLPDLPDAEGGEGGVEGGGGLVEWGRGVSKGVECVDVGGGCRCGWGVSNWVEE